MEVDNISESLLLLILKIIHFIFISPNSIIPIGVFRIHYSTIILPSTLKSMIL